MTALNCCFYSDFLKQQQHIFSCSLPILLSTDGNADDFEAFGLEPASPHTAMKETSDKEKATKGRGRGGEKREKKTAERKERATPSKGAGKGTIASSACMMSAVAEANRKRLASALPVSSSSSRDYRSPVDNAEELASAAEGYGRVAGFASNETTRRRPTEPVDHMMMQRAARSMAASASSAGSSGFPFTAGQSFAHGGSPAVDPRATSGGTYRGHPSSHAHSASHHQTALSLSAHSRGAERLSAGGNGTAGSGRYSIPGGPSVFSARQMGHVPSNSTAYAGSHASSSHATPSQGRQQRPQMYRSRSGYACC